MTPLPAKLTKQLLQRLLRSCAEHEIPHADSIRLSARGTNIMTADPFTQEATPDVDTGYPGSQRSASIVKLVPYA